MFFRRRKQQSWQYEIHLEVQLEHTNKLLARSTTMGAKDVDKSPTVRHHVDRMICEAQFIRKKFPAYKSAPMRVVVYRVNGDKLEEVAATYKITVTAG